MASAAAYHAPTFDPRAKRWIAAVAMSALTVATAIAVYRALPAATVQTGPVQALAMNHLSFGRMGSSQAVDLHVKRSKGQTVRVTFDRQFAQAYTIEETTPMARTVTSDDTGAQVWTFQAPADADLSVKLSLRPVAWGQHDVPVRADVPGVLSADLIMSQFVVP